MPYKIKYDADTKCMMCRMFGQLHSSDLPGFASESSAFLKQHNCGLILNDLREVDLHLSTIDLYNIPKLVAGAGIKHNTKRAIVFSKDAEDYQFLETVSVNCEQFVRVFTDFDEALTWFKGNEDS